MQLMERAGTGRRFARETSSDISQVQIGSGGKIPCGDCKAVCLGTGGGIFVWETGGGKFVSRFPFLQKLGPLRVQKITALAASRADARGNN